MHTPIRFYRDKMGSLFSSNEEEENETLPTSSHANAQPAAQPAAQPDAGFRHAVPNAEEIVATMLKDTIPTIPRCEGQFIHDYFRRIEDEPVDDCLLWERHPDLNEQMYTILIDWIESLQAPLGVRPEVIYLTVCLLYTSPSPRD